jgi:RimJ/RimL family protein N-acetyltransferase
LKGARTVDRIRFAEFDPDAHLDLLSSWLAVPDVAEWWPDAAYQLEEARRCTGGRQHRLILFDGQPIGYTRWQRVDTSALSSLGLHNIPEGSVVLDILIGEPDLLGAGIGSQAASLLCQELFLDPSIPMVGTVTSTENHRAIRAFKKAGLALLQEYDDERYGRCVVLACRRPGSARERSRALASPDRADRWVGPADLRVERVPPGQTELLLDMMAAFNEAEELPWSRGRVEPAVQKLLSSPDLGVICYVVEGGEVRGYFVLTWGFDLEWTGRDAFLTELYFLEPARGRGLGRRVMQRIEELAGEHGARALHLMVRPENEPAVSLYQGAGYESPPRIFLTKALPAAKPRP